MKNFTFLMALFMIALTTSAQNKKDLQNKILQANENFSRISKRTVILLNFSERQALNAELSLKSAAATQKLDSTVNRVFNAETQVWENDYKEEYFFDSEMKFTSYLDKEWNSTTKSWDAVYKAEIGYDYQNRQYSMLTYESDTTQALIPIYKLLFLYNSEGIQDSTFWYSTNNAGVSWFLDLKSINYFNASKQLIKKDHWLLDEDSGELMLVERDTLTYSTSGKIKTSSVNYFDEGDEFINSKTEFKYDDSDKLSSIENSERIYMTYTLEKSSRSTYQYNTSGDLSVEIYSSWNGTSWVENEKDEYTYSTTDFSELAFPSFNYLFGLQEPEFDNIKAVTEINNYEILNDSWKNIEKTKFYYSGVTSTNINEFENSIISVFPNPASESISFSWKGNFESLSLEIYQITGAKVIDQTVYSGKTVSISGLDNGVYIYRLLNGQEDLKVGKMIKR